MPVCRCVKLTGQLGGGRKEPTEELEETESRQFVSIRLHVIHLYMYMCIHNIICLMYIIVSCLQSHYVSLRSRLGCGCLEQRNKYLEEMATIE